MSSRIVASSLLATVVLASLPAPAQGQGASIPSRLAALEARIAKLESGQVNEADLVGTYAFYVYGTYLAGGSQAQITSEMSVGSLTLNADGTGLATFTDAGYALVHGSPSYMSFYEFPIADVFSWSVVDGKLVIPGAFQANIGFGGRVLIVGGAGLKGEGWTNLGLLIRLPNP